MLKVSPIFFLVFVFAQANEAFAQQYGWVKIAKLRGLVSVEYTDSLHGWAGGARGAIYRTTNGGVAWDSFNVPMATKSIAMADSLHGWAVGDDGSEGKIYHTTDGGVFWSKEFGVFNRQYLATVALSYTRNLTAGGTINFFPDTAKLVQTSNGGGSWSEKILADSIVGFAKAVFTDSLYGWMTAGIRNRPGSILRTTNGGNSWDVILTPQYFQDISFIDSLRGWGTTQNPTNVYRTVDGGRNWQFQQTVIDSNYEPLANALYFLDSLNGWTFGSVFYLGIISEGIYRTSDGGVNWHRESIGLTGDLDDVSDAKMLDQYHGWAVCYDGSVLRYQITTDAEEQPLNFPRAFFLHQNYPNPFNPSTDIEYELISRTQVSLKVYDVNGKEVRTLVNQFQESGTYHVRFDGSALASGIYYYTLKAGSMSDTKEMMLVK